MKKKILIIGSNFSQKYHLRIILNLFKDAEFHIASPNIKSKKLNTNIKISKYQNYKIAMKKNRYFLILCCALPEVQENFIKLLINKNYFVNYLMLEKPVSRKIKLIKDLIEYSKYKKIKIAVNYSYSNIKIFSVMKKKINENQNFNLKFNYNFLHQYFIKKNDSWKNFISKGGGIVNYYLNHVIFSIIRQFNHIKLNKIKFKLFKNSIIELKLELLNFNNQILLDIKLKKKIYKHNYKLTFNNKSFDFGTTYKNWYKKYYFSQSKFKKTRKIYYNENFEKLILQNYKLLKNFKQNSIYENYLKDILLTEKICYQINNKIKKYDFQKM